MSEKILDVDFQDVTEEKEKRILVYRTSQVAVKLGESESTIRTWCNTFKDFLKIETSGRNRQFTETDIENLRYIKEMIRVQGYSHRKILEMLSKDKEELIEVSQNPKDPIGLKTLSVGLMEEIKPFMIEYRDLILEEISVSLAESERNRQLEIEELKNTISELSNTVNKQIEFIDIKEQEAKERDDKILDFLKNSMEIRQETQKEKKKDGILSRLFRK